MRNVARGWIGWFLVALVVMGSGAAQADLPTLVRKKVPPSAKKPPTMNGLARLVTNLEDELKKYGTITVKSPDVWGETTLMSMIQEYERYMRADAGNFQAGMQGFIARADQAALQAQMSMGIAASNATATTGEVKAVDPSKDVFAAPPGNSFNMLPSNGVTLSLEPTENTRQHSVYLKVNQALRRTNLGDDNSRQPGYTSYVLRFPVSVLPGRQTHKGCAAVVTIRARLEIDEGHLHETFPRLAISDIAASVTPWLLCQWKEKPHVDATTEPHSMLPGTSPAGRVGIATQAVDLHTFKVLYGDDVLRRLLVLANEQFVQEPKTPELEDFVLMLLTQTQGNLELQGIYEHFAQEVVHLGDAVGRHCLEEIRRIRLQTLERLIAIYDGSSGECPSAGPCDNRCEAEDQAALTWLLLAQSAVLDINLRRLARAKCGGADSLHFFLPDGDSYLAAAAAWNEMIEEMFPVHVFTLDPVVEEQNYFDAFSRRRELQLAMAMAVAKGEMRAAAAVRFTRQLSLDMLTIGLNRTAVAFAHDNDTFGWNFYPRLQSPPEESSNVAAMARLIWSTGPTRHYDLANRQLEPGMRECEAVIVMPAFVPKLKIDVTTNWERLTKPGSIKVDYVKMINEAAKIQQAVHYAAGVYDQNCYRPEDYEILCSRVDQLEKMLPLQRQYVRLPFPYVLGGKELFDSGNKELPPTLDEFYGLEWLQVYNEPDSGNGGATNGCEADCPRAAADNRSSAGRVAGSFDRARRRLEHEVSPTSYEVAGETTQAAQPDPKTDEKPAKEDEIYFFLKGRHFHPTQTHVIAGAVKADSVDGTAAIVGTGASATVKVTAPADSQKAPDVTVSTPVPQYAAPTPVEVVVLSRELLRVKLKNVTAAHTCGCVHVYVATPAGVSNALRIPLKKGDRSCCPRYPKIDADAPPESKSFSTTKACKEPPHVAPPEEVEYELQEQTPPFPPHNDDEVHELPPLTPGDAPPSNRSGAAASRAPQPLAARAVAARPLRTAAAGKAPRSTPKVVQAGAKHPSTLILRSSGDSSTRRIMTQSPRAADE